MRSLKLALLSATALALGACADMKTNSPNPLAGMTMKQRITALAPIMTGTELSNYMIPNIPEAAEAYYGPDSKHLIAQTRDPDAKKTSMGTAGALTWIFSDDGKKTWRVNDGGQDACSYIFPDNKRVIFTSTRDHTDMPVGNWSDSNDYPQGSELYIADLDGKNRKRLTNNKNRRQNGFVDYERRWHRRAPPHQYARLARRRAVLHARR